MNKKIEIWFVTDPLCQYCYYVYPQMENFKLKYNDYFDFKYVLGGMMESLTKYLEEESFVKNVEGLGLVTLDNGKDYDMPVNIQSWFENPIETSFTPIIFYNGVRKNSNSGEKFLRRLQEEFFLKGKKIDDEQFLYKLIEELEPNNKEILKSIDDGIAELVFKQDISIGKTFEVEVFPTIIMTDRKKFVKLTGYTKSLDLENALKEFVEKPEPKNINLGIEDLVNRYNNFTKEEISIILEINKETVKEYLDKELENDNIIKHNISYSSYYEKNKSK